MRIWGDEFYRVVESVDGYTLVRDDENDLICYARLSADGDRLESTGLRAGVDNPTSLGLEKHLRISKEASRAIIAEARAYAAELDRQVLADLGKTTIDPPCNGDVEAVVLLIDFSDEPATIPAAEVDDYCNSPGYTGYGNNGSVHDYFYDVSDGNLTYTNYVPAVYYRANNPKSYYDDCSISSGERARELIIEALNDLDSQGVDFSRFDSNGDGVIDGVNAFYAGYTSCGWAIGLWPHSGAVMWSADGVSTYRYQITGQSNILRLGTFCHENGHMLCYWPDLYDYGYDSAGVGRYCLMCSLGSAANPIEPCAYLKDIAGWANTTELTVYQAGITVPSATNTFYRYSHPTLSNEYYLIENRQQLFRDSSLLDGGLAIWHIDTNGSNNWQDMTPEYHYRVTLVQADGLWDLEHNVNIGDGNDLWSYPTHVECSPSTVPNTDWWDGSPSTLAVENVGAAGTLMTFDFVPAGESHVPAEYATIQAAVDASASGAVIVLADGTYTGAGNRDVDFGGKQLSVRSAGGDPAACVIDCQGDAGDPHRAFHLHSGEGPDCTFEGITIRGGHVAGSGGAVLCEGASPTFRKVVFLDNHAATGGALAFSAADPALESCTFLGNDAALGGAVSISGGSTLTALLCLIAGSTDGEAIHGAVGTDSAALTCCDVYGNAGGDWVGVLAGQEGLGDNFALDPQFCDPDAGDLTIIGHSPCAPGFHPDGSSTCGGELIGALPVACQMDVFTDVTSGPLGGTADSRGVAWGDYDGDGDPDLYVVNGDGPNRLLRNDGADVFTDVSAPPLDDAGAGNAAAWADFDNDGDLDLFLANEGSANRLMTNLGDGTFVDGTVSPISYAGASSDASWADYDRDGKVDLYVVDAAGANHLYQSFGDPGTGTWFFFEQAIAVIADTGAGRSAVWADYDNDGDPDVLVANDGTSVLAQNMYPMGFLNDTGTSGYLYWPKRGAAWADHDGDGDLDIFIVNPTALLDNEDGNFGVVFEGRPGDERLGNGIAWADVDNDTYPDAYVARAGYEDLLFWNRGGSISVVNVPGSDGQGNAVAWADYDGDGDLDAFVAADGPNQLLRNDLTSGNHWLHLDLEGTVSNRSAIGARVTAVAGGRRQIREVAAGTGPRSSDSFRVEFGLGAATTADSVIVRWPSGLGQVLTAVAADQVLDIVEHDGVSDAGDGAEPAGLPDRYALKAAEPNPFNPFTRIDFDLPRPGLTVLKVFDVQGRLVRTLVDEERRAGRHSVVWKGVDDRGRRVASGVYFYTLRSGGWGTTRKMTLVK